MANEPEQEVPESEGYELLNLVWFSTIHELDEIMCNAEQVRDRIEAARVLVDYFKHMAQSLNEPWVPDKPPFGEDEEGEDDE